MEARTFAFLFYGVQYKTSKKIMNAYLSVDDLSFEDVALQSPTAPGLPKVINASNALDRNTTTCMRTDDIGLQSPHKSTWWKVDLGGVYSIYSINILFKNYNGQGIFVFKPLRRLSGRQVTRLCLVYTQKVQSRCHAKCVSTGSVRLS